MLFLFRDQALEFKASVVIRFSLCQARKVVPGVTSVILKTAVLSWKGCVCICGCECVCAMSSQGL